MSRFRPHTDSNTRLLKHSALATAISAALAAASGGVQAQSGGAGIEEVVVTGSYIRQTEGFDAASPVTAFTAADRVGQLLACCLSRARPALRIFSMA